MSESLPPAFGGSALQGNKWVRIAFLDETGIANILHEPFAIVAGMIVLGDVDYIPLRKKLDELVNQFPATHIEKRFIHTAQIFGGYTPFTEENGWDVARRFKLLNDLAELPRTLKLPAVWGHFDRSRFVDDPRNFTKNESHYSHVHAAVNCTLQVERFMREFCPENEICSIVMENRNGVQNMLRDAHRYHVRIAEEDVQGNNKYWLPIKRIIGTPHFEEKEDAGLLQLADFLAFVLKRRMMRDDRIQDIYSKVREAIVYLHRDPSHPLS